MWKRKKTTAGGSVAERSSVGRGHLGLPWLGVVLAFAFLVGVAADVRADDVLDVGGHTFEYLGTTYDDDGSSTWSYRVTSEDKPALSHWVLEWGPSLEAANVLDASERFEVGTDPTTGVYGIKFDEGYCSDGEDDDGSGCETRTVSFTLDAWYDITDARIATKAGRETDIDEAVPGPLGSGLAGNSDPLALDDEATTKRNKYVKISVLDNDSDPDGDNLSIDSMTDPSHGQVKKSGKKKIKYTPDRDFNGIDTFTYTISDGNGGTATAWVTVIVGTVSEKPIAVDDAAFTDENVPVDIDILANDSDDDGSIVPSSVSLSKDPKHGTVAFAPATGIATYTPDPEFCGDDYFRYTVEDDLGETSDEAKVEIEVLCNQAPEANDDQALVDESTSVDIDVTANDDDPDGAVDPASVVVTKDPKHGSASVHPNTGVVTYTPDTGFCGHDDFRYRVADNDGAESDEARVDIDVTCNEPPEAADDTATTNENTSIGIDVAANDADVDGTVDPTTVVVTREPRNGTVSVHLSTGVVTYTPDPGSCGEDTFEYTIDDNDGATSREARATIDVLCNDPPLAIDDLYTVSEAGAIDVDEPGILSNDVTAPLEPLSAILLEGVAHGELVLDPDGSFLYIHDGSETSADGFAYLANDGLDDSNPATVSLVILPTNDPPTAEDDAAATDEDVSVTIDVLQNDDDIDGDGLSVDWVTQPADGSVINHGDAITYSPDPDFYGAAVFSYGITDGNGGSASATVTVTVDPVNDPPTAAHDSAMTDEDAAVSIPVLGNDDDPDGDPLVIVSLTQPESGSVDGHRDTVTYTPDPDFHGTDAFTYTISDGNGGMATAVVTVTVAAVNDPPTAFDDDASTDEDVAVTVAVLSNDLDPDGDELFIASVARPDHGEAVHDGSAVTYTPDPGFHGSDAFTYTISDGRGGAAAATVSVVVFSVNDPPSAQDDTGVTDEDTELLIDVLSNDTDPDGDDLIVRSTTQPTHGSTRIDGDRVMYTPGPGFHGSDAFTYTIEDGNGSSASATVGISVVSVNDPPTAVDDGASTDEDVAVTIDALGNDTDPDGDPLSVQSVTQPANGSAANEGDAVTYIPDPDFHGSDTFTYVASDGHGGTATATVTVTIDPVNDRPIARDDTDATDEDTPVTIDVLANDDDPDDDPLSVQSVTQPANGSVTNDGDGVTYTPDEDFHGQDTFTYTASDGHGGTASATVTVTIDPANDPPIAEDDAAITDEDTPVTIDVLENDTDTDGDGLVVQSVTQPTHGSVANGGDRVTYTPNADFHGQDAFTYTASDERGGTATAAVTVTIGAVNDPPVAQDDSAATDEDVAVAVQVLANDADPDGDTLVVQSLTQPGNGSATIDGTTVIYAPAPGFNGSDAFTYTASDGNGGVDTATVSVSIGAVNDPPVAQDDADATDEDVPVTIDVLANDIDPDGDGLVVQSVTQPAHGSVANAGVRVTYTPNPDFHGSDAFAYTVSDGNGGTATAAVTVTIGAVNDPPVAQDDSTATDEDVPVTVSVLTNDTDPDGDALAVQSVTQPAHGSVTIDGDAVTYTPAPGHNGSDVFTYVVSDGNGGTDTATVRVNVAEVNQPPIASADEATTIEDVPTTIAVLANDGDPDEDAITVESVSRPLHGVSVSSGASIVYTPSPDFFGTDSFSYSVSDGKGGTASATVTVTVIPANDPPVAQDDTTSINEGKPVAIAVLVNDSDPDADPLAIQSVTQPSNGTVANQGTEVTYVPAPGFSGTDTFSYVVSDGRGKTDTATVIVTVLSVNNPPTAQNDSAVTEIGSLVSIPILGNDDDSDGDFLLVESFTDPAHGTVLNSRTGVSYIPDPRFQGVDTFSYTVSDGNGGTDTATVTVSVGTTNTPPTAADDNDITEEGASVTVFPLSNDMDPNGDDLVIESVSQAENGAVTNDRTSVTYTPDPGFNGVDLFTYTISDGRGGIDTATAFIAVASVNDAPIAQDDSASTEEGIAVTVSVLDNDLDPDGDPLTVTIVSQPEHGSVAGSGSDLIYIPDDGFVGTDTFTYAIADRAGETDTATVTIGVAGVAGRGGQTDEPTPEFACDGRVIISEIAWAGTASDVRDEWIELRNLGARDVDLAGWTLRWRRTHPSTPDEQRWKIVELSGTLEAADVPACAAAGQPSEPSVLVRQASPDDVSWTVFSNVQASSTGFFLLEHRHDASVSDVAADLVYDRSQTENLEFSDLGEIVLLVNDRGEVVDTANAFNLGRNGWAAGQASTHGTMERIDPLGGDVAENWQTNLGVVIDGLDARERPLRATAGTENSPSLENLPQTQGIPSKTVRAGETLEIEFTLSRQDRKTAGWPWISVARPGFAGQAGAGGAIASADYSFAGGYRAGDQYDLEIGTADLPPGTYTFWIIYGEGRAVLVPIVVAR